MFWTDLLSIIKSLNTAFTAIGICHTSYNDCLLERFHPDLANRQSNITSMTSTNCCEYSIKAPDDGQ